MDNISSEETSPAPVDCIDALFTNETAHCGPMSSGFEPSIISRHRTTAIVVCFTAVLTSVGFNAALISHLIRRPGIIITSSRNALLLNLAIADVLLSLTYNVVMLHRMHCERWPFGAHGCIGYGFGLAIFGCVRNATLSLFSIERCALVIFTIHLSILPLINYNKSSFHIYY